MSGVGGVVGAGGGGKTGDMEVGFVREMVFDKGMSVMIPLLLIGGSSHFQVFTIPVTDRRLPWTRPWLPPCGMISVAVSEGKIWVVLLLLDPHLKEDNPVIR